MGGGWGWVVAGVASLTTLNNSANAGKVSLWLIIAANSSGSAWCKQPTIRFELIGRAARSRQRDRLTTLVSRNPRGSP
jgi:hypothetical protein